MGFFVSRAVESKEVLKLIRSRWKIGRKEVLNLSKSW